MQHANSGFKYIVKCYDEQTKNHQIDMSAEQTAGMVELLESKYCPVRIVLKYKSCLSPLMNNFWQQAKTINWEESNVIGFQTLFSLSCQPYHMMLTLVKSIPITVSE